MRTGFDKADEASESGPVIVGIVGGSGSGKSWLANKLARILGNDTAVVCQDSFYKDLSHLTLEDRAAVNFDHPNALDWARLRKTLAHLASGRSARVPVYDFSTHTRTAEERLVQPSNVVIFEGLWLLHRPALRRFFSLSVFLDAGAQLCLERRLSRDVAERGRAADEVTKTYDARVLPMQRKFVEPQIWQANFVVCAPPREREVAELAQRISALVGGSL
jgi:uridine kinase